MDQNNAYLKFDKSRMVNLEYSLKREILRTNRRGGLPLYYPGGMQHP